MRRINKLLTIVLSCLILSSCGIGNSSVDQIEAFNNLSLHEEFSKGVAGSYALPITSFGVEYSSNSDKIKFEDNRILIDGTDGEEDIKETLTSKTKIEGQEYSKDFDILIKGNNEKNKIDGAVSRVTNMLNYYLSESDYLPTEFDGIKIDYKVIKGNAEFKDNHLIKTDTAKEKEEIEVEATVNNEIKITKEVLLLDEYYGYLLVSFDGDDGYPKHKTGDEYLYFMISTDKTNWKRLNNSPIITCDEGTNRFRDPYIGRKKDGSFLITSTEGFYNPSIYLSESNDLVNFNTKRVDFNERNIETGLNGDYAWAPEFVYDQIDDKYTIIYSDPSDICKGLYAVDTKDFVSFSKPYIYLNTNYNSIDGDVALLDGVYYLFYKDERNGGKNIYYAISHSINNPNWRIMDGGKLNPDSESEGPFAYHDSRDNKNYLMFDSYNTQHTYVGEVNRFSETLWTYPEPQDYWIRHFSIIQLTKKEYEQIEKAYK